MLLSAKTVDNLEEREARLREALQVNYSLHVLSRGCQ
jgi:hypothetical protein